MIKKVLLVITCLIVTKLECARPAKAVAMVQVAPEQDPYVKVYFAWVDSLTDPNSSMDTSLVIHQDSLPKLGEIIEIK
jgi:hypothetical protein